MLTMQALPPRANVHTSIHFFWVEILSCQTKGMGIAKMVKSVMMLKIPTTRTTMP